MAVLKTVAVHLTEYSIGHLNFQAERRGMSRAALVREILAVWTAELETREDNDFLLWQIRTAEDAATTVRETLRASVRREIEAEQDARELEQTKAELTAARGQLEAVRAELVKTKAEGAAAAFGMIDYQQGTVAQGGVKVKR